MKIVIMRHGEAHHYAPTDAERALTERGRNESLAVARACAEQKNMCQFDKVLVSPYLRAQQTWHEISRYFSATDIEVCEDITPYGQTDNVFDYLVALIETEQLESVLLVSHLPLVGYLSAAFVANLPAPMFPTSGIMCIEYAPVSSQGSVLWNIHP